MKNKNTLQNGLIAMFRTLSIRSVSILLFTLIIFSGCSEFPDDIILPEWDVDLNLPIANRNFTMDDVLKSRKYVYKTPGTSSDSVYLFQSDTDTYSIGIAEFLAPEEGTSLNGLTLAAGNADPQTIFIPFPEEAEVDSALFNEAIFAYNFINNSTVDVDVSLLFPDIYTQSNVPVLLNINIPPNSSVNGSYSFSAHSYRISSDFPPDKKKNFRIIVNAASSQTVLFNADLLFHSLSFSRVYGKLKSRNIGERARTIPFFLSDYRDYGGKVILKTSELNIRAEYRSDLNSGLDVDINRLQIIGVRSEGTSFILRDNNGSPYFNLNINGGLTNIKFTEVNSNVNELISFFPDSIQIIGEYILNPSNSRAGISELDSLFFETDINTRSYLAIRQSEITDTAFLNFSEKDKESISKGGEALFFIEAENAIPLSGWLKVTIADENYEPLFMLRNSQDQSDSVLFSGASVDHNGNIIGSTYNQPQTLLFPESDLIKINRAKYALYSITIYTEGESGGQPVITTIRPDAWINLKSYLTFRYRVSTNE